MSALLPEKMANPQGMKIRPFSYAEFRVNFEAASFKFARKDKPQAIAHRGYKAAFPENTMGAFKGAVKVGAHAIETDVHLTKDGVVVLSHVRTG